MKRNTLKKAFALVLCVMMVIGCLPAAAFAYESDMDIAQYGSKEDAGALNVTYDSNAPGETEAITVANGAGQWFKWTATYPGTLYVVMPTNATWSYDIYVNDATEAAASSNALAEDAAATAAITVAAGDIVYVNANSIDRAGTAYNITYTIGAYLEGAAGTAINPISLGLWWSFFEPITASTTVTIPANSTVYYQEPFADEISTTTITFAGEGVSVTVDGATVTDSLVVAPGSSWNMNSITFTNSTDADVEVTISGVRNKIVGIVDNPAVAVIGDNAATAPSNDAYYWSFAPGAAGTLTVTATGDGENNIYLNEYAYQFEGLDGATSHTTTLDCGEYDSYIFSIGYSNWSEGPVTLTLAFEADPEPVKPAKIGDVSYDSVEAALNAAVSGDTVVMTADSDESAATLIIKPGVTLNLATYELKAGYVIGLNGGVVYADIYSGDLDTCGKLIVAQDNISLANGSLACDSAAGGGANYEYIPIWYDGGYIFAPARIAYNLTYGVDVVDGSYNTWFQFFATFKTVTRNLMASDGGAWANNGISVAATATYIRDMKEVLHYNVTDELVEQGLAYNKAIKFTLTGCQDYTDLSFTIYIASETGVVITTDVYVYDNGAVSVAS